jgi:hypothetical protein
MKESLTYTDNDIDEDMKLTHSDYKKILHHYQRDNVTLGNNKSVKERAHRILAQKLCRCIKSSNSNRNRNLDESRRIGYCTRSIFNLRGLRSHGFRCKTKSGKLLPKMTRDVTKRTRKLKLGK